MRSKNKFKHTVAFQYYIEMVMSKEEWSKGYSSVLQYKLVSFLVVANLIFHWNHYVHIHKRGAVKLVRVI